ncbi:MAG TPA: ClbS/DfsB family four-helix bundle protein [Caldilineaceae bacterium]|nr:ClbS/DfsB family four-helix bundle protein [Caldilineaceae bacterium]HRW07472.1 ClbS/DfsB family four-helix bundle protein [Caldilineaceae bacterium]
MFMKTHMLAALREEFDEWERVLAGLSEAQILAVPQPGELSLKDEIVHLWAWQQRSIARLSAGVNNTEPQMPAWWPDARVTRPEESDDHEAETDRINARIYEAFANRLWSEAYAAWHSGYLRLLEVAETLPEPALLDASRFAWLNGYSLADVLLGTYDHHQEHLDKLLAR